MFLLIIKMFKTIAAFGLLALLIGLVYLYISPERRNYTGNVPGQQIAFLESIWNDRQTMMPKIEGFDSFKSYGEEPIVGQLYTKSKSDRPYRSVNSNNEDITKNLNTTIDIEDKNIDTVGAAIDTTASLSGINGGTESSLKESMVKPELRRLRR
jgi:hypothetical protein